MDRYRISPIALAVALLGTGCGETVITLVEVPLGGGASSGGNASGGSTVAGGAGMAGSGGGRAPPIDYCVSLLRLQEAAVDATLDAPEELQPFVPTYWTGIADGAPAPPSAADIHVGWLPEGIFFSARVRDPVRAIDVPVDELWNGPSVELFVDADGQYSAPPAYDDPGTAHFVVGAPLDDDAPRRTGGIYRGKDYAVATSAIVWSSTEFIAAPEAGGYIVEALVLAADLGLADWQLSSPGAVGLNLAINVGCPVEECGSVVRKLTLVLNVAEGELLQEARILPHGTVEALCKPDLRSP